MDGTRAVSHPSGSHAHWHTSLRDPTRIRQLVDAVDSREPVSGLSHGLYRYPARFSPRFARTVIELFSHPGDVILDPFVGGGTTLVEARVAGRRGVGVDVSNLAVFVARAKTTVYDEADLQAISRWADNLRGRLNLRRATPKDDSLDQYAQLHNISTRQTWPIRKTLQLALAGLSKLRSLRQRNLARCALLRAAQSALDGRRSIPSASDFRVSIQASFRSALRGAREFAVAVRDGHRRLGRTGNCEARCFCRSVVGLESDPELRQLPPPSVVITSPPYPGVHILYHRWQIHGGRESRAPFWIAGELDGHGSSYYTFGDRHQKELARYFELAEAAFTSIAGIADRNTVVVQLIAFGDPTWQLPRYLESMSRAGFAEVSLPGMTSRGDGRLWRTVPRRKWYASRRGHTPSSQEVLLLHKLAD